MTSTNLIGSAPSVVMDWATIAWTATLAGLTLACMAVRSKFERIAKEGVAARFVAQVVIGYFGIGMSAFGIWATATGRFPVPGGAAWEGPVAVVGGMAAFVIGTATLVEHVVHVRATRAQLAEARAIVPVR